MVVRERQRVTIREAEAIINQANDKQEAIRMLHNLKPKRRQAEPRPDGGICVREAARKYGVSHTAVRKWVKNGHVVVLKRTANCLYLDDATIHKFRNGS